MVHLKGETSNSLFKILNAWETTLKNQILD